MRIPTLTLLGLALVSAVGCSNDGGDSNTTMDMAPAGPPVNEELVGTWTSETCEPTVAIPGSPTSLYLKRSYVFSSPTEFSITADLYGDAGCTSFLRLLHIDEKGTFTIGNNVSTIQGAQEAEFSVSERGVTAYVSQATQLLNQIMCGGSTNWMVGVRTDVSAAGCEPIAASTSSCPKEHDVVQITNGTELKLGSRPTSITSVCTARPAAVGPALMKQ